MNIKEFLTQNVQCYGDELIYIFNTNKKGALFGGIDSWHFINGLYVKSVSKEEIENLKLKKNETLYGKDVLNNIFLNTFGDMRIVDFHIALDSKPVKINILTPDNISSYKKEELYALAKEILKQ